MASGPTTEFRPSRRYRLKIRWLAYPFIAAAALVLILGYWGFAAAGDLWEWVAAVLTLLELLAVAGLVVFIEIWVSSIWYELRADDVLVHKGVIVQTLKLVPFRNITNIARKRDIFDRWVFRLGSLEVQTAGSSGTAAAEEVLVGLGDWEGIYGQIIARLAAFRHQPMTPAAVTQGGPEATDATLSDLVVELRAIRRLLEERRDGEPGP